MERVENPGLFVGLTVYNVAVPIVLVQGWLAHDLNGILLWPAVVLHAGLAVWCVLQLRRKTRS